MFSETREGSEQVLTPGSWPRFGGFPAPRAVQRVRWYLNRLRCMTPAEIRHRALRALALRAERLRIAGFVSVPAPDLSAASRPWIHTDARVDAAPYLAAARALAEGKLSVFALQDAELGCPPRWNRDPKTGVEAPLAFGMLLDYRDPRLVGDIKYLWEPNRHLHLVTLAQAYALSGDVQHFDVLRRNLESWFSSCPCPMGPNWSSALEAAIRLMNWSAAWQLLGGVFSPLFEDAEAAAFRARWLESVFQHAEFVRRNFSLYSSANNHLLGEAAAVYVAAITWPHWPRARAWLSESKAILEREALLQNAPDGVNREQAMSYQQFVLDLLLLPLLAGRANHQEFSTAYESRIEAMLEYLASVMDAGGNVPMFGDSDDALVLRLSQGERRCAFRSLLATGAIVFRRGDFKAKSGGLDDKARWLIGEGADAAFHEIDATGARLPVRRVFPDGGYYILGCDFETAREIRLTADAGPLGYQSIAAHGHADALAFTLSVGGDEFFVDPGTYAYHTQGAWRAYFRGTAGHNTVRVDGLDQSESGGNFMWLSKAYAGCSLWRPSAARDIFEGWHAGYLRLPDPVMHRRRITLEKRARRLVIEDTLEMSGAHDVELFFHCHERCGVEPVPGGYTLHREGKDLCLSLPRVLGASSRVHHGSLAPISGWVSRRFDAREPAPTIAWTARLAGKIVLRSEIMC
jgi:Heparinase II/III-like protein/Heparinase II/III N-terminus